MSQPGWNPVRLSGDQGKTQPEKSPSAISVELAVKTEEARKAFEEVIANNPEFRVKLAEEAGPAKLHILELDDDLKQSFSFIESILQSEDGSEVFLTAPCLESGILLEAMRAGVKEFFPQPIQKEEIQQALEKVASRSKSLRHSPSTKVGQVIGVFGGKGGVGTTSIAVNLAVCLQKAGERKSVVLVEVNQHGGDLPLFFDLQPNHSFRDIGADLSRLDTALLTRILTKHATGVHVLPSGYDDLSSGRLTPECVEPTLKLLQSLFDYVVIDCGHVLDLTTKKVIEVSSSIVVVSTLIVPVVHRTKRVLDLLRGSGCDTDKIKLVLNRYTPEEKEVLKETEEALKFPASWLMPNDYPTASGAINNGAPLVVHAPRSQVAKCFQEMAASLITGNQDKKESTHWVDRLRKIMIGRSKPRPVHA